MDNLLTLQQEDCSGLSGGPNVITAKDFIAERGSRGEVRVTARREDAAVLVSETEEDAPAEELGRERIDSVDTSALATKHSFHVSDGHSYQWGRACGSTSPSM